MPKLGESLNPIFTKTKRVQTQPLLISDTDLEYAYVQLKVSEGTRGKSFFAKTGGNMKGLNRSKKKFLRSSQQIYKISRKNRSNFELFNTRVQYISGNQKGRRKSPRKCLLHLRNFKNPHTEQAKKGHVFSQKFNLVKHKK